MLYIVPPDSACLEVSCQLDGSKSVARTEEEREIWDAWRRDMEQTYGEEIFLESDMVESGKLPVREVAKQWNCSPGTASRRIQRYYSDLRSEIIKKVTQNILWQFRTKNGSTIHPITGKHLSDTTDMWAIAIKNSSIIYPSPPDVARLSSDVESLIHQTFNLKNQLRREIYLGIWVNSGFYYLELTFLEAEESAAIELGVNHEQKAIYHLQSQQTIWLEEIIRRAA